MNLSMVQYTPLNQSDSAYFFAYCLHISIYFYTFAQSQIIIFITIQIMIADQPIKCPLCGDKVEYHSIQSHEKNCKTMNKYLTHPTSEQKIAYPIEEMIPCLECGAKVPFNMYTFHLQQCEGNQMTLCEDCGIVFPTSVLYDHANFCTAKVPPPENLYNPPINPEEFEFQEKQKPKGLTKEEIKKLRPIFMLRGEECSICQTAMKKGHRVVSLGCGHKFHRKCVEPWLFENPNCPMCRNHALTKKEKKK